MTNKSNYNIIDTKKRGFLLSEQKEKHVYLDKCFTVLETFFVSLACILSEVNLKSSLKFYGCFEDENLKKATRDQSLPLSNASKSKSSNR